MQIIPSPLVSEWREQPRFSTMYNQVPDTFRLSATKVFGTWGDNAQNKDKALRYLFCADKGKKMGQVDQYGAEALIVAYLCRADSKFRALFNYDIKPHTYMAAKIFRDIWYQKGHTAIDELMQCPIKDLKNHPAWKPLEKAIKKSDDEPMRYYYLGKKTIHAKNYNEGVNTFITSVIEETDGLVVIPLLMGEKIFRDHEETFPEIRRDFQMGAINMASANRKVLRNLFGYPREFTGRWDDNEWRKMYAFIPQSTVGCITNIAITKMFNDIMDNNIPHKDWQFDILQNGHDSVLFQFRDDPSIEKEVIPYVRGCMEQELHNFNGEKFRMRTEAGVGYNWGNRKEAIVNGVKVILNPQGLDDVTHLYPAKFLSNN